MIPHWHDLGSDRPFREVVGVEVAVAVPVVVAGKVIVVVAAMVEASLGPPKNRFHDTVVKCCRPFASVVSLVIGSGLDEYATF